MSWKAQIVVGVIISMVTSVALTLYFSTTEEPQAATAMEWCVEKHLKAVPGNRHPGAAIEFTQICKEELRTR